ncbi:hypothetical protein PSHT_05381 [Puccinia striiformis]|uniref:Phosphatidylglycerol/phosphatidylinositol transfer protein n=1 Tax=Puccinia striiformis TaxID=27350 RepID=A0A2S4WAQ6_9BASI|nr:hypothetical protein PSHT_05381 [Puccinia striiformis]
MSITANVPTTPTKRVPTTTSELHNLQYRLSFENLTTESDLTLGQVTPVQQHHRLIPSPSKTPESYYTAQLNKFNLEKSAALSNDRVVHHKNSSGNLSTTSRAITVTTSHDDEWDRHDELTTTGSNYNDDQSETASLRNLSIEPSQPPMMSTKFKQFTRTESTGLDTDPLTISSIKIDPSPPKAGQNLTVRATGTIRRLIEDGAYAVVTVKVGLVRLLQKTFDVCEELRKADVSLQCPMEPGDFDIAYEITLPKEIPPVTYRIDALAYTTDDDDMACANFSVDFSRKP